VYLKTWYDPLLEAPREPRVIDDSAPRPADRPLVTLRRRIAAAMFELGHWIAPEPRSVAGLRPAYRPQRDRC